MLDEALRQWVESLWKQDGFDDDVTTTLLGAQGQEKASAVIYSRQQGVFCGNRIARAMAPWGISALTSDGALIEPNQPLIRWNHTRAVCLSGERTILNILSHLCGIATLTRRYVDAVAGTSTRILATRKTLPGLRDLQLYAVQCGGGFIHRRSLSDGILIKDNHLDCASAADLLARARAQRSPLHGIEIEVTSLAQLRALLADPPDIVLLDNMDGEELRQAIELARPHCRVEVSGRMTPEKAAQVAQWGADAVSAGALTHSVTALDLTLEFVSA